MSTQPPNDCCRGLDPKGCGETPDALCQREIELDEEIARQDAVERNGRVQARYDELMRAGKHGHYETMFQVVREEVARAAHNEVR